MQFAGKMIVVTGAASGIGRALLHALSRYLCRIVATDIDERALETTVEALIHTPAQISSVVADVATPEGIVTVLDAAAERGPIDLFFANAGFGRYGLLDDLDSDSDSWDNLDAMYRLNVFSPIWTAKLLRERYPNRRCRLVVTASAMSIVGLPGYAVYASTKGALHRFADAYRYELGADTALTLVYPVATRTKFFERASEAAAPLPWPSQTPEEVAESIVRGVEADRAFISPSRIFTLFLRSGPFQPLAAWIIQKQEKRRLNTWLKAQGKPPV